MHEIRVAEDLSVIILEAAGKGKLNRVTGVNIIFGQLVQIVPDIFRSAFAEAVRGTIAEDAEVSIEIMPVMMKCVDCGSIFKVSNNIFSCGLCKSSDLEIIEGKEMFVKSIEGD